MAFVFVLLFGEYVDYRRHVLGFLFLCFGLSRFRVGLSGGLGCRLSWGRVGLSWVRPGWLQFGRVAVLGPGSRRERFVFVGRRYVVVDFVLLLVLLGGLLLLLGRWHFDIEQTVQDVGVGHLLFELGGGGEQLRLQVFVCHYLNYRYKRL